MSSTKWLLACYLKKNNHDESETFYPLPRFKKIMKFIFGMIIFLYGIDCPNKCHVVSQGKLFKEPNHHHISVQWWNTYFQIAF